MNLDTEIKSLYGVGDVKARRLNKLGIYSVRDLIYFLPRAYQNRGIITPLLYSVEGQNASFILTVGTQPKSAKLKGRLVITKFMAFDSTGDAEIVFYNSPYITTVFSPGEEYRFFGKAEKKGKRYIISSPEFERITSGKPLSDFVSVYHLTQGLSEKTLSSLIEKTLEDVLPQIHENLPIDLLEKYSLPSISFALKNIHKPNDNRSLSASLYRLAFDELFYFAICISMSRKELSKRYVKALKSNNVDDFINTLPYELTNAQKKAINEIISQMVSEKELVCEMNRILIGDVGSGKTVCAAAAVFAVIREGHQTAIMVPTEILASQHFADFTKMFSGRKYKIALLTGSTKTKEKEEIYKGIADGSIDLLIGTHTVISDKTEFKDLLLTITDEQHRFGVMQRAKLKEKSQNSHTLVMSATPIPRTFALTIYGDLDVSLIDEMPKGRERVDTFFVNESYRERVNCFIRKQVSLGGQVYIVCPSIEDSEKLDDCEVQIDSLIADNFGKKSLIPLDLKNATEYSVKLKNEIFPDLRIGLLHGKMKSKEKEVVMSDFVSHKLDILVSTTVIEVGVNVPSATLMIIENAERFGLSQLHQLRGRVGRGNQKSYCILISDTNSDTAKQRLHTMSVTYDGYKIAQADLEARGPGDFFSQYNDEMRQSGGAAFKVASLCDDPKLLENAFACAGEVAARGISPDIRLEAQRIFQINENTIN